MTYGEIFFIWAKRILLVILLISIVGMAVTSIAKARAAVSRSDAYIRYLDSKYDW